MEFFAFFIRFCFFLTEMNLEMKNSQWKLLAVTVIIDTLPQSKKFQRRMKRNRKKREKFKNTKNFFCWWFIFSREIFLETCLSSAGTHLHKKKKNNTEITVYAYFIGLFDGHIRQSARWLKTLSGSKKKKNEYLHKKKVERRKLSSTIIGYTQEKSQLKWNFWPYGETELQIER